MVSGNIWAFVALNDELLKSSVARGICRQRPTRISSDARLDPLRLKARLLIEGFAFGKTFGAGRTPQQFDVAVLGGPVAGAENSDRRA